MTPGNGSELNPTMLTKELEECYERLERLVGHSNESFGEELYHIVMEADQLITELTNASKREGTVFKREELLNLNQKVTSLIETIKQQMSSSKEQLTKVKKGQSALKGYRPIRLGMGFTEGKFFDSKK